MYFIIDIESRLFDTPISHGIQKKWRYMFSPTIGFRVFIIPSGTLLYNKSHGRSENSCSVNVMYDGHNL